MLLFIGCQRPPASPPPPQTPAQKFSGLTGAPSQKEVLLKFLEQHKTLSNSLIQKGLQAIDVGNARNGIQDFLKARSIYPIGIKSYALLAELYLHLNKYDEALKVIELAGGQVGQYPILYEHLFQQQWWPAPKPPTARVTIALFKNNKKAAISFLFCDGDTSNYTDAFPLFEKYGFLATFALVPGEIDGHMAGRAPWADWEKVYKKGFEICNHTMYHRNLSDPKNLNPDYLEYAINHSYDLIKKHFHQPPTCFVFPGQNDARASIKVAEERHIVIVRHDNLKKVYARVFIPYYGGPYFSLKDARALIHFGIKNHMWLIPMCHGVRGKETWAMFRAISRSFLDKHLQYLKEHKKDLWVDTVSHVFEYLNERKNSKIVMIASGKRHVVFDIKTTLPLKTYSVPLTAVINAAPKTPHHIRAVDHVQKPLLAKIDGSRIYVQVPPGIGPVHVSWD